MDDRTLTTEIAAGDRTALRAAYETYGRDLFLFALTLTKGNEADAEDVLQECFVRAWESRSRLAAVGSLRRYLFTVTRNVFLNLRRTETREQRRRIEGAGRSSLIVKGPPGSEMDMERINRALQNLPEDQKEIVVLRIWGRLTSAEAAQVVGVSENTASSRYRYALEKLRNQLGDMQ